MTLKEQVREDLERLDEGGLREVADFVAFLQFRTRRHAALGWVEAKMAALYAECAEEDRALAEVGMADYAARLSREDAPHPQSLPPPRYGGSATRGRKQARGAG